MRGLSLCDWKLPIIFTDAYFQLLAIHMVENYRNLDFL